MGFYWNTGGLKATVKKAIGPRNSERFALDEISGFPYFEGWVYVDSDQPVLPAGYTKAPVPLQWSNQHEAHYPMTFYQAEGIEPPEYIEIQDLPPAKAVHDLR